MEVTDLLARIEGVRQCGDAQWEGRCPSGRHPDNRASLSVARGDDGRILLHCHAGCDPEAVVSGLGLRMADLMPPDNGQPEIAVTYDYRDEQGALLYQVCRMRPKDFRQRSPKPGGGWTWKVKGIRKVPYRLPEIVQVDATEVIFVVEGEKDADRLVGSGCVATCNVGGALKWRKEYAEHFRGRRVVILPDNDPQGQKHAHQVAKSLHGAAVSVKTIELPGLPEKGDASDWFDAGGTVEQLRELAKASPEWEPGAAQPVEPGWRDRRRFEVTNAQVERGGEEEKVVPLPMSEVLHRIFHRADKWPRQVEGALFVDDPERGDDERICWLKGPSELFGSTTCGEAKV
ncbi:MAG: hypothetical protein ACYTG0_06080 [Planctomycetota bacterium]|jgi:hypothetical protein